MKKLHELFRPLGARTLGVVLVGLSTCLFVGCGDPSGGSSSPISCETNDDCPSNYTCELSDEEPAEGSDAGVSRVCKYDGGSNIPVVDGPPVALDQLPQKYAEIVCGRIFGCCDEAEKQEVLSEFGGAANEAECQTKAQALFGNLLGQMNDSVESGRATYSADNAGDCLATMESLDCSYGVFPDGAAEPEVCEKTLEGQVEDGGECYSDEECVVGECMGQEWSENGEVTQPGTCSTGFAIGEACEWSDECVEGTYCNQEYDEDTGEFVGTCEKIGDVGDACGGSSQSCKDGLFCDQQYDSDTGQTVGTCKAPSAVGESCDSGGCVDGAYCETYDPETGESPNVCKARKGEGEGCNYGQCNESTYCKVAEDGSSGSFSGTCTALKAAGEPCESSDECMSSWCGTSASNPEAGNTCQSDGSTDGAMCDGA
ncbi:hypothetical protein FIV42_13575 [Persicimonas caeni]|uniref:Dickkopf N-terminal cysteine-rich domain-containing protein n=1 Tax=Persicimonas caeni TaxID=2292766 RepID=A0A4Y6PU16_PERCE|nr:hypothetical protein [Persicimonas caeni]QDG51740.1 hypothetical protein FIV42_13575 [Persicimonas caeni]QED32961.1 hypothetical protein FRD00_13570 [Persicimonas caeni]